MFESQPLKKEAHWNVLSQSVCYFCWGLDLNREIPERTQFKHVTFSPNFGLTVIFLCQMSPLSSSQKAGGLHPAKINGAGTWSHVFFWVQMIFQKLQGCWNVSPLRWCYQPGKSSFEGPYVQVMEPACCLISMFHPKSGDDLKELIPNWVAAITFCLKAIPRWWTARGVTIHVWKGHLMIPKRIRW